MPVRQTVYNKVESDTVIKTTTYRALIPLLLSAAVLVVLINTLFAFRSVRTLLDSEQLVEHTWQGIYQVELIMGSAKDAETGNRGYLITGDEAYLDPYNDAVRQLPKQLDTFGSLTSDSPVQQAYLRQMRAGLEQRLDLLAQGIQLRREGMVDGVRAMVISGTGKAEMDRLRGIADEEEAEERRLLATRTLKAQEANRTAKFVIWLAGTLDLLLIVGMFRYFYRERTLRIATERTAEALALANAEVKAQADEVRRLNTTLEERVRQRTAELETTNRELEAFSYSVSHDLRAPLRTIDGFSLALEEDYADAVDATGRDYIRRVRNGVQRMGQLIDALLQLSRITRAEILREDVNVSELAERVVGNLQEETEGNAVAFEVEPGLRASADPKLLQVALENLLGNAVKFSSKTANPRIAFGFDQLEKAFFVRDNGAGFDMHYVDKLFNAFNRLHGDKDFTGSGIGLATVARVVRRHHGRIWAQSAVNLGATFWFTLG